MAIGISSPAMERENTDATKLELYHLIREEYKAMQEGRGNAIGDVCERIKKRRVECD